MSRDTPPSDRALVFTRAAVREVDRLAVEQYGVPSIVLMENAAIHATAAALRMLPDRSAPRVLILCGPGNNGGDGLAMARLLSNAGCRVGVLLAAPPERCAGDAALNLRIVIRMGLPVTVADPAAPSLDAVREGPGGAAPPDLIVDALLGTGLERTVQEPLATLIGRINAAAAGGVPVLAVDIPSGLDADTGRPLGVAVRATLTVTFVGLKQGFLALEAQPYVGECVVADIGAPRALVERLGRPLQPEGREGDEPPRRHDPPAAEATPGRDAP